MKTLSDDDNDDNDDGDDDDDVNVLGTCKLN